MSPWQQTEQSDPQYNEGFKQYVDGKGYRYYWSSLKHKIRCVGNGKIKQITCFSKPVQQTREELVTELDRWFCNEKRVVTIE